MNWELVIAGAGLALGVFNVIAWLVELRDRKAEVAEERRVRSEQLEMERQRFRAEQEDRTKSQRAEITAEASGYSRSSGQGEYHWMIRNLGPSSAKHIEVELRDFDDKAVTYPARRENWCRVPLAREAPRDAVRAKPLIGANVGVVQRCGRAVK